jgi:DNA-binding transcriptional MerR regulator
MAKSPNAFRTISEAAEEVGAPQHVLRFWETKFEFVAPVKRAGGRRFYRPQDIVILKAIRRLLHDEGLTIKGVQKLYKEQGLPSLAAYGDADAAFSMEAEPGVAANPASHRIESAADMDDRDRVLRTILADLESARARLDAVLTR